MSKVQFEFLTRKGLLFAMFPARASLNIRAGSWQNGFFVDFYFWAAGSFRGICHRICSPLLLWEKKCPEKQSSRKSRGKILQNLYNKNPRHISAEGLGQKIKGLKSPLSKVNLINMQRSLVVRFGCDAGILTQLKPQVTTCDAVCR